MNGIKQHFIIPDYFTLSNITSIYKNKGSKSDLNNDRGIFIISVFKKVLDKLTYNEFYETIDSNMSDSNIGSRKCQNIRNHLFIVYSVINEVLRKKDICIDIQIYDLIKAFDNLWLEDSLND